MAVPGAVDIDIYQGDTFSLRITLRDKETGDPVSLNGHLVLAQIRVRPTDATPAAVFSAALEPPQTGGVILLSLAAAATARLPAGVLFWDVQTTAPAPSTVRTWAAGRAKVAAEVSRP